MKRLRRLCEATRAISPACRITFHGVPDREDLWVVRITAADVILVETHALTLEKAIGEANRRLTTISQRVMNAVTANGDDPEESEDPPTSVKVEKP